MRFPIPSPLLMLLSITLVASGCSKDGDDNAQANNSNGGLVNPGGGGGGGGGGTQNATQLLCDKNYKMTAATIDPAYQGSTDYYSLLSSCFTDNIYRFAQNGSVNIDEGAEKCDPNDPQTLDGTWTLTQNNTVLTLTVDGDNDVLEVITLNGNILKLRWQEQDQGQTYTITGTWTKQ